MDLSWGCFTTRTLFFKEENMQIWASRQSQGLPVPLIRAFSCNDRKHHGSTLQRVSHRPDRFPGGEGQCSWAESALTALLQLPSLHRNDWSTVKPWEKNVSYLGSSCQKEGDTQLDMALRPPLETRLRQVPGTWQDSPETAAVLARQVGRQGRGRGSRSKWCHWGYLRSEGMETKPRRVLGVGVFSKLGN